MSRFGTDYQIARITGRCAATGRVLEPGSPCIAALCEKPDEEGFERRDFSVDAWEGGARPQGLFSFWRTLVPRPDERPRLVLDDDVLQDLFERLANDERPQRAAFRFVLGLLLIRRKRLKFVGRDVQPKCEYWLLQPRSTGGEVSDCPAPRHRVLNPQLSDDDIRSLMDQLSEVLQNEL